MADDALTQPPQDEETRLAQLNRIVAWTEPKPKPEPEALREEAEAS